MGNIVLGWEEIRLNEDKVGEQQYRFFSFASLLLFFFFFFDDGTSSSFRYHLSLTLCWQ